jgi:predicted nucleic acid-binding protein
MLSETNVMTHRYGIDTSILVRLATGDPEKDFVLCVRKLTALLDQHSVEILASNQVIGEAYMALQHHYGVSKAAARAALISVMKSGLVAPLNGVGVFDALQATAGCGLFDRLIADDYRHAGLITLTLDRKMATLTQTQRL